MNDQEFGDHIAELVDTRRTVPWSQVKAALTEDFSKERREKWEKALSRARVRYRSEIRKHRGTPRLRAMYRRRKR